MVEIVDIAAAASVGAANTAAAVAAASIGVADMVAAFETVDIAAPIAAASVGEANMTAAAAAVASVAAARVDQAEVVAARVDFATGCCLARRKNPMKTLPISSTPRLCSADSALALAVVVVVVAAAEVVGNAFRRRAIPKFFDAEQGRRRFWFKTKLNALRHQITL